MASDKFKKGDKVLVECVYVSDVPSVRGGLLELFDPIVATMEEYSDSDPRLAGRTAFAPPDRIHPHPGVPVADLLEEIERLWAIIDLFDPPFLNSEYRVREFRAAREAAQKPIRKHGDEVWVRGTIAGMGTLVRFSDGTIAGPDPDDIRPDDE